MRIIQSLLASTLLIISFNTLGAGLLTPINSSASPLQIKSHDVSVTIEDGYAITQVDQVFSNPNSQDLEAHYSFPVPAHAAVAEFTVWIDGKAVTAEVLEKKRAKKIYEQEKAAGRDAGLMEKDTYKTFDIKVSPVRANQDAKIRFTYIQSTFTDTGMGRYIYPLEEGGVDEKKLSFWTATETVDERFSFDMKLRSGYPIEAIRLPAHPQASISNDDEKNWSVKLLSGASNADEEEGAALQPTTAPAFELNKDIVVYWRHKQGLPGSVDLVTYKPENNNKGTFMLTLTPGDDLAPITEGSDWTFILDISGSMSGKYATLVDGVEQALSKLRGNDRFRLITFNNNTTDLTSGYVAATPENIQHFSQALINTQVGGGTDLYRGITKGLNRIDSDRTSSIFLITDGVANIGETQQRKFIELLKQNDIRIFTFIMGNSANRPLLENITKVSNGFALNVSNSDDIVGKILEASQKVTHESLHGVKLSIKGIKTSDLTPDNISSIYRGQQLIVMGHYFGEGLAQIQLSGHVSGKEISYKTQINFPTQTTLNPELERLWAYASIEQLQAEQENYGENADTKQAIIDLSTQYGVLTDQTAMLVVKEEVFQQEGIQRQNKQRLETEKQAKLKRQSTPVKQHRADTQQPMFSSNRASHGGGAFGGGFLAILLIALARRQWESAKQ